MEGMDKAEGMDKIQMKFIMFAKKLWIGEEIIEKIQEEFSKKSSEDWVVIKKIEVKVKPEWEPVDRLDKWEEKMPTMEEVTEMSKEELIPLIHKLFIKYKKEEINKEMTPSTPLDTVVRNNCGY